MRDPVELEVYLRDVCAHSGFERETVLAQIGVTAAQAEALKKPAPVRAAAPVRRTQEKDTALAAERMAVTLLAGGHMPKELFRPEDIRDEGLRAIAEKLLAGVTPAMILEEASVEERELAASVFSEQAFQQEEDALTVAADCLRRLRLARLEEQMTAARKQAAEETDPDRRKAALERVMRLNAEMTKLKQPNRMKGADLI